MTSPTAHANADRLEARKRLSELIMRDIKEASNAEGLWMSDVLTVLASASAFVIGMQTRDSGEKRMDLLDKFAEVVEKMLGELPG